jgi:thiamine-monophosphate kinase
MQLNERIKDIGEQGLLLRLQQFCPPEIIGDDAALLTPTAGLSLVVTSDMLVDGVHFSDQTTAPEDVGWRAAAANLSDLAAMGATPLGITVSLGLPADLSVAWVERVYQGLTDCLQTYGTVLVGGDVCRSSVTTLGITALGQVHPTEAILRQTAQPGDAILVTGVHGASRAGLELLLNPEWGRHLSLDQQKQLIRAHQHPCPRLDVVQILRDLYPHTRVAGMDSSDGLADAIVQICRASGVGAQVWQAALPIPIPLRTTSGLTTEQVEDWVLYGGEDFELVLCLPAELARQLLAHLDEGAAIVGEVTAAANRIELVTPNQTIPLGLAQGFQHF